METLETFIAAPLQAAAGWGLAQASGLFGPQSRFYLPYILTALAIAVAANLLRKRAPGDEKHGVFSGVFDPAIYFNASSLVDLKVVLANRLFTPLLALFSRSAVVVTAYAVATLLAGEPAANGGAAEPGLYALLAVTFAVTVASDLTTYFIHRLHHESPVLWPFHKLHHSAETLTPLTFARKHPVYDLIRAVANAFLVGPVQGVVFALFGITDIVLILGVNAAYAVFFWTGANLRHSHVWVSYGPVLNRIFISPAMHQIHHSCAVRHHDKNYGEIFALWDWMFGTLYLPQGYEALEFGVADREGRRIAQPHPTLKDAWLVPFRECAAALKEGRKPVAAPAQLEN